MPAVKTRVARPTAVRIVGHRWTIDWVDETTMRNRGLDDNIVGLTFGQTGEILMADWISVDMQRERLLHEIMHACMFSAVPNGIEFDDHEEVVLSAIDGPLWATLKNNPKVLAWIVSEGD
jgi:hypothetical protein